LPRRACQRIAITAREDDRRDVLSRARDDGFDRVAWFSSGDWSLSDALACVAAARTMGFARVGLVAPDSDAPPEQLCALQSAGLAEVELALHAATADANDYVTGRAGAFAATAGALATCAEIKLRALVRTVLVRANYRQLDDLAAYLSRARVAAWCIEAPSADSIDAEDETQFARTCPRLALAVPFALRAVARARDLGLAAWFRNIPLCLVGPMTSRSLPSAPRAYGAACADCAARPSCTGIDDAYLRRFGASEFRPRTDIAAICEDDDVGTSFVPAPPVGTR
jgi:hypothetical protein